MALTNGLQIDATHSSCETALDQAAEGVSILTKSKQQPVASSGQKGLLQSDIVLCGLKTFTLPASLVIRQSCCRVSILLQSKLTQQIDDYLGMCDDV